MYYSLGYKFVSKWDGVPIDVGAWTEVRAGKDGNPKLFLFPERDVNPFAQPSERTTTKREREGGENEEEQARRPSLFQLLERARNLYKYLTALSFVHK